MVYRGLTRSPTIIVYTVLFVFASSTFVKILAWAPDMQAKFDIRYEEVKSEQFLGNRTSPDYFKLLFATDNYVLLGGRNNLYNLSTDNLHENADQRLSWSSAEAHAQLCFVKGKNEHECQNYVRVVAKYDETTLFICGTNSGKPVCKEFRYSDVYDKFMPGIETDGVGQCPYSPNDNTTALYYHGHLYTATVPEFSGGDALIYRKPQRTERSDFKSLNAPNFVSSFGHGDYVFFFYRETAVEYMNCGKAIYSRVGRVCKDDKGGPHQFQDRWTTFLKARLNCSIPGDYPFYFDELQATTEVIRGKYNDRYDELIYGVMTTPVNAIGGSAVCAYSLRDIINVFDGSFKGQEDINANWLPVPNDKVPSPRPGQCVNDSRTLTDPVVNFVKMHPLMEQAVPSYFSKPVLVHVSLQYRFTAIAVDPQVKSIDGNYYDVLYIGTDNGKLLKAVYKSEGKDKSVEGIVISRSQVLPPGTPITGLKVVRAKNKVIIVSKTQVRSVKLNHCINISSCGDCVTLQDPHCAWDIGEGLCVETNPGMVENENFLQSISDGNLSKCQNLRPKNKVIEPSIVHQKAILSAIGEQDIKKVEEQLTFKVLTDNNILPSINEVPPTPVQPMMIQKAETFVLLLFIPCFVTLVVGFVVGFIFSRRFHPVSSLVDTSVTEQHNHLNRFSSQHLNSTNSSFLPPRANKAINLACNIPPNKNLIKKDNNLDASKELNNSIESIDKNTLQKVKKTYI